MEFYKLYHIIHRNTGWERMSREIAESAFPELYIEKKRQARTALAKLMMVSSLVHSLDTSYY